MIDTFYKLIRNNENTKNTEGNENIEFIDVSFKGMTSYARSDVEAFKSFCDFFLNQGGDYNKLSQYLTIEPNRKDLSIRFRLANLNDIKLLLDNY